MRGNLNSYFNNFQTVYSHQFAFVRSFDQYSELIRIGDIGSHKKRGRSRAAPFMQYPEIGGRILDKKVLKNVFCLIFRIITLIAIDIQIDGLVKILCKFFTGACFEINGDISEIE